MKISVVVPFYNTKTEYFAECINALKKLDIFEVILVDDCSTNKDIIQLAKKSGFRYLKTKKNSGSDGVPTQLGIENAKGDYICRVDSDDILLELPKKFNTDICFGNIDRLGSANHLSFEKMILQPQPFFNALIAKKEIFIKHPLVLDKNIYSDILFLMQLLFHNYTYSYYNKVNYIYRDTEGSIINSQSAIYQRLLHVQTVSRFCQIEKLSKENSVRYMALAMKHFYYGINSINHLNKAMPLYKNLP